MSENQNNSRNRSNSDRYADNDRRTRRRRNAVVEMDPSYIPSEFEIQGDPVLEHQTKKAQKEAMNSVSVAKHNAINANRSVQSYEEDQWYRNVGARTKQAGDALTIFGGGSVVGEQVDNAFLGGTISSVAAVFAAKTAGASLLAGGALSYLGNKMVKSFDDKHNAAKEKKSSTEQEFEKAKQNAKDAGIETWHRSDLSTSVFMNKQHLDSHDEHMRNVRAQESEGIFESPTRTRSKSR